MWTVLHTYSFLCVVIISLYTKTTQSLSKFAYIFYFVYYCIFLFTKTTQPHSKEIYRQFSYILPVCVTITSPNNINKSVIERSTHKQ